MKSYFKSQPIEAAKQKSKAETFNTEENYWKYL